MNKRNLLEFGHKLENIISRKDNDCSSNVIEILNVLQSLKIDPLLIRNAKIILTINNLRKSLTNEEVIRLSKSLLISWKNRVMAENNAIKETIIKGLNSTKETTKYMTGRIKFKNEFERILKSGTTNENRLKSRELLSKALMSDKPLKDDILKIARLAVEIEKFIFQEFNNTDNKYKIRVRSRISNLSDEQNCDLRANVLNGEIKAEEIAKMSSQEMASDRMKRLRELFHKQSICESTLPEVFGTQSDLLKCPECRKDNCTYNQVQIERADEPMTTFCLCISCGYRWKF